MIKDDNTRISVTVPKELYDRLSKDADFEDRSISNFVLKIIKDFYRIKSDE